MYSQKKHKLHKFATTNSNFQNIDPFRHVSLSSKIGLVDQSKPCSQIHLLKIANCINLQLAIRILKNHAFRTYTTL